MERGAPSPSSYWWGPAVHPDLPGAEQKKSIGGMGMKKRKGKYTAGKVLRHVV